MRTAIGCAHGWLSLQPDGRVEFRPLHEDPGPWEMFDFPGFVAYTPPPVTEPPVEPPVEPPASGILAAISPVEQTAEYIARVKQWLLSQGRNLSGPCGAFDIVCNAVWYLRLPYPTCGLLDKPGGNQCRGFATDIIMFSDQGGQIIDVLGDGGGANVPQWGVSDIVDPSRWRAPVPPV
jgi:hypothetical protein